MSQVNKIINLFIVYTILSICISILGWIMVYSGFADVPNDITSQIGPLELTLAVLIYGSGLANVWTLFKFRTFHKSLFIGYIGIQALALILSSVQHGWLFFPAAGSQGTIPAIIISVSMYYYLQKKLENGLIVMS